MALPWDSSKADAELSESTDMFTFSKTGPVHNHNYHNYHQASSE